MQIRRVVGAVVGGVALICASVSGALTATEIKLTQVCLEEAGFYQGPIHGVADTRTEEALWQYAIARRGVKALQGAVGLGGAALGQWWREVGEQLAKECAAPAEPRPMLPPLFPGGPAIPGLTASEQRQLEPLIKEFERQKSPAPPWWKVWAK